MNLEKPDVNKNEREGEQKPKKAYGGSRFIGRDKPQHRDGKKWLFYTVDALLLAAIIATILVIVSLLTPFSIFKDREKEAREVTFAVEMAGVSGAEIAALQIGDTVLDAESGEPLGTITAIDIRAYEPFTDTPVWDEALQSFVVAKTSYGDEFKTIVITIKASATYEQGVGFTVEDCRIALGRDYELRMPAFTGSGVCVALEGGN